ncbi:MAG: carboxypeptidase M32 [Cyanobium sp.]
MAASASTPPPPITALAPLRDYLHTTRLLGSIHSTLYFDQNTVMPSASSAWRGEQLALLARQIHARQSSPAFEELLSAAETALGELEQTDPACPQAAAQRNLRLLRQELQRQQRLDPLLVGRLAEAQARGYGLWQEARARADFGLFAPALRDLVALRQEQARQLAEPRSCWESLAQVFEPDISHARLAALFGPLRQRLPELLEQAAALPPAPAIPWDLPEAEQERLSRELLEGWGYDPARCVRSRSPHPFSCTVGPADFRITTRVLPGMPFSAFLATAHEWGHSRYEQGLPRGDDHYFPWPLGEATSMGVHESQSLFFECRLARSRAFAVRWYPRFRNLLGSDPWGGEQAFWRALNPMRAGLNRVEADELSYCLHIVLRYELERALLEQDLAVEELPEQWNNGMERLLGLRPANDAEGCLQDVHWSEGLFGYFPSYALGHLISAQLGESLEAEIGPIEAHLQSHGDQRVIGWLERHVWPLGRQVNGEELVEAVSGRALTAEPFLAYLEAKLARLGG